MLARSVRELNTGTSYYFTLQANKMEVGRYNSSYSATTLTSKSHVGSSPGQIMRSRIALFGSSIRARTWRADAAEPTSIWHIDIVDTVVGGSGYFGFTQAVSSSGAKRLQIDNVGIFDTRTPEIQRYALESWLSPYGTFSKSMPRLFPATVTPSGDLSVRRVVLRSFSGSIEASGISSRAIPKILSGSIVAVGGISKVAYRFFEGSSRPNATIARRPWRFFAGEINLSGETRARNAGRIFGKPGMAIIKIKKAGQARARIRRG